VCLLLYQRLASWACWVGTGLPAAPAVVWEWRKGCAHGDIRGLEAAPSHGLQQLGATGSPGACVCTPAGLCLAEG
jgi:hypothetical protein